MSRVSILKSTQKKVTNQSINNPLTFLELLGCKQVHLRVLRLLLKNNQSFAQDLSFSALSFLRLDLSVLELPYFQPEMRARDVQLRILSLELRESTF